MFLNWSSSLWGCELKKFWWTRTKTGKRHPPCEDVSWKVLDSIDWDSPNMSSSLWGCELKNEAYGTLTDRDYVILLVRMWVEKIPLKKELHLLGSSSLWGCELKNPFYTLLLCCKYRHPPCEDVSWKSNLVYIILWLQCHPPCEDVSWKIEPINKHTRPNSHPPCEDVSWKVVLRPHTPARSCHPPCEDVSWKLYMGKVMVDPETGHPPCEDVSWKNIWQQHCWWSWCHPPCEDVSWKVHLQPTSKTTTVILLVRMWVENKISGYLIDPTGSSSLWGCELKSQEPFLNCIFFWSSSLWGCELKKQSCMAVKLTHSHPPCEDVSWKSVIGLDKKKFRSHPPCEDVSWKTCEYYKYFLFWVILLVRMWVEKY